MGLGIFGKLPAHGDFICRGLPSGLRKALDHWVTRHIGQQELPADGLRARLMLDGAPVLTVIVGSHDKRGRVFPIVAVTTDGGHPSDDMDQWCDITADGLCKAVNEAMDADALLNTLPPAPEGTGANVSHQDMVWKKGQTPQTLSQGLAALSSD